MEYKVRWSAEFNAKSPEDAAKQAYALMKEGNVYDMGYYRVYDINHQIKNGEYMEVDLAEDFEFQIQNEKKDVTNLEEVKISSVSLVKSGGNPFSVIREENVILSEQDKKDIVEENATQLKEDLEEASKQRMKDLKPK
jgi:hypothetical protein